MNTPWGKSDSKTTYARGVSFVGFESWIENHWPKDVPHDCSKLNDYEQDCIATQDHREGKYCSSCTTYASLTTEFYRLYPNYLSEVAGVTEAI